MKRATIALALAVTALPTVSFAQVTKSPNAEATLTIGGDAAVERDPDLARVDATIVTNDDVASRSAAKNAAIYTALKAKLLGLGIANEAISTNAFDVAFVPRPRGGVPPNEVPQRYGYVTSRTLAIAVTPLEGAGKIVDAALAVGVTQVDDVAFELKDRKGAYREALARAFADARANATALAGSDVVLVRIASVSAGDVDLVRPQPYAGAMRAESFAKSLPPTQIERGGPISVTARVTVTYIVR